MKIRMLETRRGSEDGFTVRRFKKGWEGEVADTLASTFIRHGWACRSEPAEDPRGRIIGNLDRFTSDFDRMFRPQPTRGSAPTHPDTLRATGKL